MNNDEISEYALRYAEKKLDKMGIVYNSGQILWNLYDCCVYGLLFQRRMIIVDESETG